MLSQSALRLAASAMLGAIASLITNSLGELRRGAGWKQQLLAALIIALSLGGLAAFAGGIGDSIDCRSPEGLCALPLLIAGVSGAVAMLIGLVMNLMNWNSASRLTRAAGLIALPVILMMLIADLIR